MGKTEVEIEILLLAQTFQLVKYIYPIFSHIQLQILFFFYERRDMMIEFASNDNVIK